MASTFTTNKSIEKPANGDYINTWSTPVNSDWDIIDTALGGTTTLNAVGASGVVTLSTSQYRPPIIFVTGTLTANVNYQFPTGVGGFWYIYNNTSGAFSVTFSSASGGTTVTIPQGYTTQIICSPPTGVGIGTTSVPPTAAGSNTQVQYNSSGAFAGSSKFTWNNSTGLLGITGSLGLIGAGSNTVSVTAPATGTWTFTLPTSAGSSGQYLTTDGSGNTSWSTINTGVASFSAGTTGFTPSTATGGAVTLAGTLNVANGGTGATTLSGYLFGNGTSAVTASSTIPGSAISGAISGAAGSVANALTVDNSGSGAASGTTFNGSAPITISYNTVGAPSTTGSGASGTWGINISGNAATATSATTASSATTAAGLTGTPSITVNAITGDSIALTGATGGNKGSGSLNAAALFINGVAVGTGSGSVTSVGLALPSIFNVSGSPVTTSGTLTGTLASQAQNSVFAGPTSGSGTPTFRALVAADVPTLNQNTTGTASNVTGTVAIGNGGTGATTAANALTNLGAYAASNPAGYITSSALAGYATQSYVTSQGYITSSANISGTAANVTGTVAIGNGGTGATTAAAALSNLGAYPSTNPNGYITSSGTAYNISQYTINQNLGTGNSPTFSGLTYNGGGAFTHYASSTFSSGSITVQSGGSPSGGSSGDIYFIY